MEAKVREVCVCVCAIARVCLRELFFTDLVTIVKLVGKVESLPQVFLTKTFSPL